MIYKKCLICGKEFSIIPSRAKTAKYCSTICQLEMLKKTGGVWKGKKRSKKTIQRMKDANNPGRFKLESTPWNKGKTGVYSEESLKKMGDASKGRTPWNKGKTGVYSEETIKKIKDARAKQKNPSGKSHWAWKENPGYSAVHKWLVRKYGNPLSCDICGKIGQSVSRKNETTYWDIEWSNKTGRYIKDIKHFRGLCIKCHINHDKRT